MNCNNPQCHDRSDFRQDPMAEMSSWYTDQGYPPCGMPPKKIQPLNNTASRPSGRATWLPPDSCAMPGGMGNMPSDMRPMPANMGNMPSNVGNMPSDMGPMPTNRGTMPEMSRTMPERRNDMCFGKDLSRFPIGMGYVPMQKWSQPSPINEAFCRGTLFAELDLPFVMGRCM